MLPWKKGSISYFLSTQYLLKEPLLHDRHQTWYLGTPIAYMILIVKMSQGHKSEDKKYCLLSLEPLA